MRELIENWVHTDLSVVDAQAGFAPCPFAKKALQDDRLKVVECLDQEDLWKTVVAQCKKLTSKHSVVICVEENATRTTALGGSSTANQFAQVDYSNLKNVGGNMYQPVPETSAFDSFLEKFGMKERKRRSSGQIYSPNKSRSFFDNPVGYLLGS